MLKNLAIKILCMKLFVTTVLFTFASCSTPVKTKKGSSDPQLHAPTVKLSDAELMGPPAPYGPVQAEPQKPTEGLAYGPEPFAAKSIVLVLGPGLARGFAHAGVLKALQEEKIPVAAIVATEMGALVGSLYAQAVSINAFEWALQKYKPEYFQEKSGVFFQKNDSVPKKLKAEIEKSFGTKKFQDLKKPVRIILIQNKSFVVAGNGSGSIAARVSEAVEAALTGNGYYTEASYQSHAATGSTLERPYPVSEAQALGLGPVVVVDLMNHEDSHSDKLGQSFLKAEKNGEKDLSEAALVIKPVLGHISYLDFSKKSEAIFKGKSAVKENLKFIRPLAGLPAEKLEEENSDEKK